MNTEIRDNYPAILVKTIVAVSIIVMFGVIVFELMYYA